MSLREIAKELALEFPYSADDLLVHLRGAKDRLVRNLGYTEDEAEELLPGVLRSALRLAAAKNLPADEVLALLRRSGDGRSR